MAELQNENVIPVKPAANVYTVMMAIAIIMLVAAIFVVGLKLLSPLPNGYGLTIGDLFKSVTDIVK